MILYHCTTCTFSLILLLYSDHTSKVWGGTTARVSSPLTAAAQPASVNGNATAAATTFSHVQTPPSSRNASDQLVTLRPPPYYPELGAGSRIFSYLRLSRKALLGHIIAAWDIEDIYTTKTLKYDLIAEYFRIGDCADAPITPKQEISLLNQVRSFELANVKPWSSLAITIKGEDVTVGVVDHMTSVIVTHDTTPTGTVFNIEPISVQPNSAQLVWQPPLCESKGGLLYKYDIEMAPLASPMNVLYVSASSEYVSLTDLTPYTRYQIRIRYVNGVGSGPFCPFVVFETTQGPPSAPIIYNFTYDDTTIGVIIVQPVLPNGRIDQYHIQLTGGVHHMSNLYTPLNGTEYVIGNLKPNSTYRIRACARNAAGWGEWSYEIQVVTKFEIKPSPSALRQTFANRTCIGFHWAPPIKDFTSIHSYLVSLSTLDKKLLPVSATVNRDSFDHLQCYLSPFTQYSVTVSVVKETGQIGHPLGARMWTEGMVPPKPRPPVVRTVTTSTITVEIFPVIFDNGPITSYQIRLLRVLHNHTIKDPHPFGENAFQPNVPLSFLDEEGIGSPPKLQPAPGGPALPQRNQAPVIKPVGKRSIPEFDLPNGGSGPMDLEPNDSRIVLWAVAPFSARHCSLKVWFMEWKGSLGANKDLEISHCNKETLKRTEPLAVGTLSEPRPHPRYDTRPGSSDVIGRVLESSDVTVGKAGGKSGLKGNTAGFKSEQQTVGEDVRYGDWRTRRKFNRRPRPKRSFGSPPGILWLELSNNDLSEATYVTIGDEKMYYGKQNQALEPDTEYGIVFVVASTVVDVTKHAYVLATTTAFTKSKEEDLMTEREKIILLAAVVPVLLLLFIIMGFFVIRHLITAGKEEKRKKASESDDRRKKKNMDDNNEEVDEESNEDYDMPLQVGDSSDFLSRPAKANSKLEQFFNPTKSVGQPRYITTMRDNIMYDDNRNKALLDADDNNSADLRPVVSGNTCSLSSSSDLQHVESDCDCDGRPPAHWEHSDNFNNNRGGLFASPASTNTTVGSHSLMACPADQESFTRQLLPGGVDNARTSSRCQKDEVIKICINNDGSDGSAEDEADLESSCIDSPPRAYSGMGYALVDAVVLLNGSCDEDQLGMARRVPVCPNSLQLSLSTTRTSATPSISGVGKQKRSEQAQLPWDVNNNSTNVDDSFDERSRKAEIGTSFQGRISLGVNLCPLGTSMTTNVFDSKIWTSETFQSDKIDIIKPLYDLTYAESEDFQQDGDLLTISLNEKKSWVEIETRKKDIEYADTDYRKSDSIQSFVVTNLINDVLKNYSSSSSRRSNMEDKISSNNKTVRIGSRNSNVSRFHSLLGQDKEMTDLDVSAAVDTTAFSGSSTSASDLETVTLNDLGADINQCACGGLPDSACSFSKSNFSNLPRSPSHRTEPRQTKNHRNTPAFRFGGSCRSVPGSETIFNSTLVCESSRPFDPLSSMDNTSTQSSISAPSMKDSLPVNVNVRKIQQMGEHSLPIDTAQLQILGQEGRTQNVGGDDLETLMLFSETASSRHLRKAQRAIDTSHSKEFFRWDFESYNVMAESSDNNCDCLNADHLQIADDWEVGAEDMTLDRDYHEWGQVMISDQETAPYGGPCHGCNTVDLNNNSTRRCCCCCYECKEDDKSYPHESESDLEKTMHSLTKISQPTNLDKARQDVKHEKSLEELANYFIANVPTRKSGANPVKGGGTSNTMVNSNANNNCDSADSNGCRRGPRSTDDGDVKTRRELVGNGCKGGKVRLPSKGGEGTNKEAGKRNDGYTSESCASDGDVSRSEITSEVTDKDFGISRSKIKNVDRKRTHGHWGKHTKGLGNIFKNPIKPQCRFGKACNSNERVDKEFPISTKKSVSFVFRKKKRRETLGEIDTAEHACSRAKSGVKEVPPSNTWKGGCTWAKAKVAEGNLSSNRSPDRELQCRYSRPHVSQSDEDSDDDDTDESENDELATESEDGESETESEMESEVETCAKSYTAPNKVAKTAPSHPSPQRSSPKTDNLEVETGQQSLGATEYPSVATPQEAARSKPPKKRWFSFWPFTKKSAEKMKDAKQDCCVPDEKQFHLSNHGKDDVQKKPERSMSDTAVQTKALSTDKFKKLHGPLFQGSAPGVMPYPITVSPILYPTITQVMPRYPVLANHIPTCVPQLQPYHVYPRPMINMNYSRKYEAPPPRARQTPNRHASQLHDKVTFKDEFLSLEKYKKHLMRTLSFDVALRNLDKNRFYYILPPDDTRVTVEMVAAGDADYYNASYMDLGGDIHYIAAQTPFSPATVSDFWRLVLQNKVQTIVMMCACVEGGIIKSEQFWASTGVYAGGQVLVETMSQVQYADFVVRTLKLTSSCADEVIVTQFQFMTWPTNGVPDDPIPLLDLRYRVRHYYGSRTTPILVVCGTGAARSAVYIAVDLLIEEYGRNGCVNVYNFVKRMRKSRPFMVRTLSQYIFIYECLFEEFQAGDTVLRTDLRERYKALCQKNPQSDFTFLMDQFRLLLNFTPELTPRTCTIAMLKENAMKNVDQKIVPPDLYCPYPVNESDIKLTQYINAVVVDGYRRKSEYIITQTPLHHTVFDFWRMVYEFQAQTIVHLGGCRGPNQEQYFPKTYVRQFGCLQVQHVNTVKSGPMTTRNLKLWTTSQGGVDKRAIRHFQVKQWDDHDSLPNNRIDQFPESKANMLSLIEVVLDWQVVANRRSRPVVVVCRDGATLSGLFVTCAVICEKMRENKEVDLYRTVKHIKRRRPQIISDFDQYRFLHQVLWEFIITHLDLDQDVLDTESQEDDSTTDESTDSFIEEQHCSYPIKAKAARTWEQLAPPKSKSLHIIENDLSGTRAKMDNLKPVQSRRIMNSKSFGLNVLKEPGVDYFNSQPSLPHKKSQLNTNIPGESKFDQSHKKLVIDHLTSSSKPSLRTVLSHQRREIELDESLEPSNENYVFTPQQSPIASHLHRSQSKKRQLPFDHRVMDGSSLPCYPNYSDWPTQSRAKYRSAMSGQNFDDPRFTAHYTRSMRQPYESTRESPEQTLEKNLLYRSDASARRMGTNANQQQYEFYQQKVSPMGSEYNPRTLPRDALQSFPGRMSRGVVPTSKYSNLSRETFEQRDFSKSSLLPWASGHGPRDLSSRSQRSSGYRLNVDSRYRMGGNRVSSLLHSLYPFDDFPGHGSRSESNLKRSRASGLDEFLRSQGRLSLRELDLTSAEEARNASRRYESSNVDWNSRNVRQEFTATGLNFREYPLSTWPGTRSSVHGLSTLEEEPSQIPLTAEKCVPMDRDLQGFGSTKISPSQFNEDTISEHVRRIVSKRADDLQDMRDSGPSPDKELEMAPAERPRSRRLSKDVDTISSFRSKLFSNKDDSVQANLEFDDFRDEMATKQSSTADPGKSLRLSVPHSTPAPNRSHAVNSRVWRNSSKSVNSKLSAVGAEVGGRSNLLRHDRSTRRLPDTQRVPANKNVMSYCSQQGPSDVTGGQHDAAHVGRNTSTGQDDAGPGDLKVSGRTFRRSAAYRADQVPLNEITGDSRTVKDRKSSIQVSNTLPKGNSSIKSYSSIRNERLGSLREMEKSLNSKTMFSNNIPAAGVTRDLSGKSSEVTANWRGGNSAAALTYSDLVVPSSPDKLIRRQSSRSKSSAYLQIPTEFHELSDGRVASQNEVNSRRIKSQQAAPHSGTRKGSIVVDDFLPEPHVVESKRGAVTLRAPEQSVTKSQLSALRGSSRNVQLPPDRQGVLIQEESLDLKAYSGSHLSPQYDQTQSGAHRLLPVPGGDRDQSLEEQTQKPKEHIVTQFRVCVPRNKSPLGTASGGTSYLGGKDKSVVSFETPDKAEDPERLYDSHVTFVSSSEKLNDRERLSPETSRAELSFRGQQTPCEYRDKEKPPRPCGVQQARSESCGVMSNNSFDESSSPSEYDVSFRIT